MSSIKNDAVDAALVPLGMFTVIKGHAVADAAKKAGGLKNLSKDALVTSLKEGSKPMLLASVVGGAAFFVGKRMNNYFHPDSPPEPVKEGGHVERLAQERASRTGYEMER